MWWLLAGAALLALSRRNATPMPAENLSGENTRPGWQNTDPVDPTVAPSQGERVANTNPLNTWLEKSFGLRVPQLAPLPVLSNASAPPMSMQFQPAAPAGTWEDGSLGMPAIPGTWTPSTSQAPPAGFVDLSDPNLNMIMMPWGDEVIYVPDPVLL